MKLCYYKLGNYDYTKGCRTEPDKLLFAYGYEGRIDIVKADAEFLKHTGLTKIPSDVVCRIEK